MIELVILGGESPIIDEKKPSLPIKNIIKVKGSSNEFTIQIIHPNKNAEGVNEVLYEKVHKVKSKDPMVQFEEAAELAKNIILKEFADLKTEHEEIKHIPAYKRGKMVLKEKEKEEEEEKDFFEEVSLGEILYNYMLREGIDEEGLSLKLEEDLDSTIDLLENKVEKVDTKLINKLSKKLALPKEVFESVLKK